MSSLPEWVVYNPRLAPEPSHWPFLLMIKALQFPSHRWYIYLRWEQHLQKTNTACTIDLCIAVTHGQYFNQCVSCKTSISSLVFWSYACRTTYIVIATPSQHSLRYSQLGTRAPWITQCLFESLEGVYWPHVTTSRAQTGFHKAWASHNEAFAASTICQRFGLDIMLTTMLWLAVTSFWKSQALLFCGLAVVS